MKGLKTRKEIKKGNIDKYKDEERDDALPRLEHAEANGAVDVDDPRALQHLAAGEHVTKPVPIAHEAALEAFFRAEEGGKQS